MSTTSYLILFLFLGIAGGFLVAYYIKNQMNKGESNSITNFLNNTGKQNHNKANDHKKIFINYRKEDSSGYSLALYHELKRWYGRNAIFKDFNNIEPGEDFEEAIGHALNSCNILLVIISDKWIEIFRQRQNSRPQQDFVTLEISTALLKNIYTIPITINGAPMPSEEDLPEDLKKLTRRQSLNIDQTRFETDTLRLIHIIDKRLGIKRKL